MDIAAITELRYRYREALVAGEKYRELAGTVPAWTEFYDALRRLMNALPATWH